MALKTKGTKQGCAPKLGTEKNENEYKAYSVTSLDQEIQGMQSPEKEALKEKME